MATIIKNGTIITMNVNRDIAKADVLIQEDRIVGIGCFEPGPDDIVIDAEGQLVIPGLIQTHIHLCQTLFRGMANDLELLDWLNLRIWPLEAGHDAESLYYSSLLGSAELLRGGTTSLIDMGTVHHTDSIFEAVSKIGIRYLGGKCMMDHGELNAALLREDTDVSLQESVDLLERWDGKDSGRIRYAFCPRFVPSCSDTMLREVQSLASQYHVAVHTHASENRSEIELVEKERGMRNILYLDSLGLCNDRLILAHCIHVDEEEMKVIHDRGVHVAHCPSSNMKLASGVAPIWPYIIQGTSVGMGADGAPSNDNLNMFMEMRLAAFLQKPLYGPTSMPAEKVFEMATIGGARAMGMENEIGSIESGKKADIAVIDLDYLHSSPHSKASVYAQLVYQVQPQNVFCTLVDGKTVMLNGKILTASEEEVKAGAEASLQRVTGKLGM
ncbi:MAG: 5'-deoxyadenosine deaminase [Bacillota bacterium]|nr:5'-deoxyadenosine deaminase [Bacillota bacterium]